MTELITRSFMMFQESGPLRWFSFLALVLLSLISLLFWLELCNNEITEIDKAGPKIITFAVSLIGCLNSKKYSISDIWVNAALFLHEAVNLMGYDPTKTTSKRKQLDESITYPGMTHKKTNK